MKNANDINAYRGLLFPVDGPVAPVSIRPGQVFDDLYREMQCSMVEVVTLVPGVDLWCDEEALLNPSPQPNRIWLTRHRAGILRRALFGNVIVLGRNDDGSARSLTLDEADEAIVRVMATSRELAVAGDPRPAHGDLARWIEGGIDWRR